MIDFMKRTSLYRELSVTKTRKRVLFEQVEPLGGITVR